MYAYARNNPLLYTDPDGRDYNVCDVQGQNCRSFDDQTWANFRDTNGIQQAGNGDLSVTNDNGSQTSIGNAEYYDPTAGNAVAFLNWSIGTLALNYAAGAGEAAIGIAADALAFTRAGRLAAGSTTAAKQHEPSLVLSRR